MPRAGESQLSLSVRQEGSGAMRMLLIALGFGTNPFLTRLRSLKRKTSSFFIHALARGQDGVIPSFYAYCSFTKHLVLSG